MIRKVSYESQERREAQVLAALNAEGIKSLEEANEICEAAGLFGDGVDVVLRGRFIVADHGVAADRAGVSARVAHRVVPHRRAHVELGRAGAIADVVEVVRVHVRVGEHDGRIGGTPLGAREGGPAARRRVVLEHRMRLARDDGVRVRAEDLAVGVDELLPFLRIGVDVDGVGLTRPNLTGLPTRIIRSHWDLGPLFDFDGVRAAKNIALGYMDTMREFGRLGGTAYGILPDENSFMQDFAAEYQAQLSAAISRAPTLALTEALARQHKHYPAAFSENLTAPTRGAIAPLELAAEMVDVPSEVPYTPKLLALTFMGQCDKDPADRYKTLLGREEGNILGEAAMATAVPEDFVTALVSHTLSKMPSAKFL